MIIIYFYREDVLSNGEQQRVQIARLLLRKKINPPKLILLDECLS